MQLNIVNDNKISSQSIIQNSFVNLNNTNINSNVYYNNSNISKDTYTNTIDCKVNVFNNILLREYTSLTNINLILSFSNFSKIITNTVKIIYGERYTLAQTINNALNFEIEYNGIVKMFTSSPNISIYSIIDELIAFIQSEYGYQGTYVSGNYYRGTISNLPDGFNIKSLNDVLYFNKTSCYTGINSDIIQLYNIDFNNNIINSNIITQRQFDGIGFITSDDITCTYTVEQNI